MNINTKAEIREVLGMPFNDFHNTVRQQAKEIHKTRNADRAIVTALLGYDNICKNRCTYCGMRAGYPGLKRYRMDIADIHKAEEAVKFLDLHGIFLISGEDPGYDFANIISMVEYGKKLGLYVSLGAGELSPDNYAALESAGLDQYVLKFETSNRDLFAKIKPSTTFEKRMRCIETIKNSSMKLASGNIIGLPYQPIDDIVEDIMLMKELGINWAPVIPYLPVPNTPLAQEGGRGSLETTMKEIAILRIMMPAVHITAQQPGEDMENGLADFQGNLNALNAGADMLFIDMLPPSFAVDFNVINNRMLQDVANVNRLIASAGMNVLRDDTPE